MFLKELKVRDIDLDKVEIIINKYMKSTLTECGIHKDFP